MRLRTPVLCSLLAVSLAGCGSTVQVEGQRTVAVGGGIAGTRPTGGSSLPTGHASGSQVEPGGAGAGATGAVTQPGAVGGQPTTPVGVLPPVARGGRIVVGYLTSKDVQSAGAALGLAGIYTGDQDNQMRTMAAAINARGGILGRTVVVVGHDVRTTDATSNPDAVAAEVCAAMAEARAFALVNFQVTLADSSGLKACLRRQGIVAVDSTGIQSPATEFGPDLPGMYAPSAMSIDRYLPAVVDRLVAQGFFRGWDTRRGDPGTAPVRIGVQAFDTVSGRHYVDVLERALRGHGLKLDERDLHSTDISQNASATSAAVLRFNANGVTHVFNANVLFYKDADSQRYYPRYAIDDTIDTPALLAQNVGVAGQKGQLHGAMGAGYLPAYEVPNPADVSPAARQCRETMRKAGEDTSQSLVLAIVLQVCDAMTFLHAALTAGGEISAAGLAAGLDRLDGHESVITYASRPTRAHHDGAAEVRDFVYDDPCGCFRYPTTQTHPVA